MEGNVFSRVCLSSGGVPITWFTGTGKKEPLSFQAEGSDGKGLVRKDSPLPQACLDRATFVQWGPPTPPPTPHARLGRHTAPSKQVE